jgi:hypothetical protein
MQKIHELQNELINTPFKTSNKNIELGNKMILILDSIMYKKPVEISFYSNEIIYEITNHKCTNCNRNAEYLCNNNKYCWHHVQTIVL